MCSFLRRCPTGIGSERSRIPDVMTVKMRSPKQKPRNTDGQVLPKVSRDAGAGILSKLSSSPLFRRRKFIVNKGVQLRLLLLSLGYIIFFCIVVASALFIPLIIRLNNPYAVTQELQESATQILYLHDKFWLAAFLALIVVDNHHNN